MGKDKLFISKIKNSTDIITKNNNTFNELISKRRTQHENSYFQRNDERWDVYNQRYLKIDPHFVVHGTSIKKDFITQLNHTQKKVYARTKWLSTNIAKLNTFTYTSVVSNYVIILLFFDVVPIVLYIVFLVLYKENTGYMRVE